MVKKKEIIEYTKEIIEIALNYDKEYRGGCGRGEIDEELAKRIAYYIKHEKEK